ncbi:MAG: hypothetical protein ABI573_02300 [Chloroflexota bacterium]
MSKSSKTTSATEAADIAASPSASPAVGAAVDDDVAGRSGRESGDLLVAMSPRQIIGGFAVLAGLIVMLRRRRRDKG